MENVTRAKKGTDALLALLLNAAVAAVLLLLFRPFFETNDDTALLTLVNGAKYSADPHMVISGIWMGRLLMLLYSLPWNLPWYTLTQYVMLFLSFTGVTYILMRRIGRVWGLVLSLCLVSWFGYESYVVIQFSRTAGIASASAMFMLFYVATGLFPALEKPDAGRTGGGGHSRWLRSRQRESGKRRAQVLEEQQIRKGRYPGQEPHPQRMFERRVRERHFGADRFVLCVLAIVLSMLASWLRFTQFLPCAALTSGIGLWMMLVLIQQHLHDRRLMYLEAGRMIAGDRGGRKRPVWLVVKLAGLILPFVLVFGICLVFRIDDKRAYRKGDVWETFREFDIRREELYDYGFPDYASNLETYREAGISDAGNELYRSWNFADPDRFTVEVMDKLIAVKAEKHFTRQMLKDFLQTVPKGLIGRPFVWFLLFMLAAYFVSGSAEKKSFLAILWGLCLFGVLYLYLYYNGRYLRSRVDLALVYALVLCVAWFVRPQGVKRTFWIIPVLVICMLFVPSMKQNFRTRAGSVKRVERMQRRRTRLEQLSADGEHLYVMKMGSLVANDCYGPLDVMPDRVISNLLYLGGWAAYTKAFRDTMNAYDISNPYRDLIDNERVFLVDDNVELTLTYLRENYAPNARCEKAGEVQKFGVYRIFSN